MHKKVFYSIKFISFSYLLKILEMLNDLPEIYGVEKVSNHI